MPTFLDSVFTPFCLLTAGLDVYVASLGHSPGHYSFMAALLAFGAGFRIRGRLIRG